MTCAAAHLYLLILLNIARIITKIARQVETEGNPEIQKKQSSEQIITKGFSKIAMQQQSAQTGVAEREERKEEKPLGPWNVLCPEGKSISFACLQPKCYKSALHCDDAQCPHCYGLHSFCKKLPIDTFTQFLDENCNRQSSLMQVAWQIEQEMVRTIQESQQAIRKQLHYNGLPNSIKSVLKNIFGNHHFKHLSGVDIECLQEQIRRFRPMDKQKLIYQHALKTRREIQAYVDEKMEIITSLEANQRIISKIITKEEDIEFVFDALGQPRKLQLLYRGTQNQFSAAKFHQKCDQIQHTLTIVKTEFDRVIAGYTPLKWSSPSTWTAFCDNSGRSFLMQIDLKQKIALTEPLYAIYCHQNHGPRFGRSDLALPNKCNQNNCTGNFPASYNILGKYTNGQQSYLSFMGSPKGFYFRAIQYEVFRVIYDPSNL